MEVVPPNRCKVDLSGGVDISWKNLARPVWSHAFKILFRDSIESFSVAFSDPGLSMDCRGLASERILSLLY